MCRVACNTPQLLLGGRILYTGTAECVIRVLIVFGTSTYSNRSLVRVQQSSVPPLPVSVAPVLLVVDLSVCAEMKSLLNSLQDTTVSSPRMVE